MGRELLNIPIELIHSSEKPSREVFEDIDVLAQSIKTHGVIQPILLSFEESAGCIL